MVPRLLPRGTMRRSASGMPDLSGARLRAPASWEPADRPLLAIVAIGADPSRSRSFGQECPQGITCQGRVVKPARPAEKTRCEWPASDVWLIGHQSREG